MLFAGRAELFNSPIESIISHNEKPQKNSLCGGTGKKKMQFCTFYGGRFYEVQPTV